MLTPTRREEPSSGITLGVRTKGDVGDDDRDRAQAMVTDVLIRHRHAIGDARLRLSRLDRAPLLVQVNLRVCGAPARIQVTGPDPATAITTAAGRLDRQIRRLTTAWEPWPWPDPERSAFGVPGEAAISRVKTYRLIAGMPCQAAAYLNAMDYDVFLYTDAETGEDAIVYRAGPTGLTLARQRTMRPPSLPVTLPLTINPRATPTLTPAEAAAWLAEHWLPFVFFTDPATGRGNLLYRRYDGQLGLITPHAGDSRRLYIPRMPTSPKEEHVGHSD